MKKGNLWSGETGISIRLFLGAMTLILLILLGKICMFYAQGEKDAGAAPEESKSHSSCWSVCEEDLSALLKSAFPVDLSALSVTISTQEEVQFSAVLDTDALIALDLPNAMVSLLRLMPSGSYPIEGSFQMGLLGGLPILQNPTLSVCGMALPETVCDLLVKAVQDAVQASVKEEGIEFVSLHSEQGILHIQFQMQQKTQ